jgi:hypothetical protein
MESVAVNYRRNDNKKWNCYIVNGLQDRNKPPYGQASKKPVASP